MNSQSHSALNHSIVRTVVILAIVFACNRAFVLAGEIYSPGRGVNPGGSYSPSNIETIDQQSGNLMLNVPLASLPPGRGGIGAALSLGYNSKLWDMDSFTQEPELGGGLYVNAENSDDGGWRYGYKYKIKAEHNCANPNPYKISLVMPDGSKHLLVLPGYTDEKGYTSTAPDGTLSCTNPPTPQPQGMLTYSTVDGSYLRLDVYPDGDGNAENNTWTLYLSDGSRVVHNPASGIFQRVYDRNNNYIDYQENSADAAYNGRKTTYIMDPILARKIVIVYDSDQNYSAFPNQDIIVSKGFNGADIITKVLWKNIQVTKTFKHCFSGEFCHPPESLARTFRVVDKITLPSQLGATLYYSFGYNTGWGELTEVQMPSGAKTTYTYLYNNQTGNEMTAPKIVSNRPVQKTFTYDQDYDGIITSVTETWTYQATYYSTLNFEPPETASVTVTSPNGSTSTDYFDYWTGVKPPEYAAQRGIWKSVAADGGTSERYYQNNLPTGDAVLNSANFYAKYEYATITDANGTPTKTKIIEYEYDKNGNVTKVKEYDWVNFWEIPRNGAGRPTGLPAGAPLIRISVTDYYNAAPEASTADYSNANIYALSSSPRLRSLPKSVEIQNTQQTPFSRSEMFYDDTTNRGNLIETKTWSSWKNGSFQAYSNPLTAANSISAIIQYDPTYFQPVSMTDGRGVQTQIVYGCINGQTSCAATEQNLYPTQTIVASNFPAVAQTASSEYDFSTGLVKKTTTHGYNAGENIISEIIYDAIGRPTISKAAVGTAQEIWTKNEYFISDTGSTNWKSHVVSKADLYAKDDGRSVSIQHFDQLGRVRLARTLEDAATQSATNETHGIKVQTRYQTSSVCTFDSAKTCSSQVVSNPYRAAYSYNAGNEPTMGWTRNQVQRDGKRSEAESFSGITPPVPWGNNPNSLGKVITESSSNTKTVTDQAGKKRKGISDALGRMIEVVEDPAGENLSTFYTFDVLGNLRKTVQGVQTRYFMFDSLSRVVNARQPEQNARIGYSATDPVTGNTEWSDSYSYDENGNTVSTTDARGITITGIYDQLNRLTFRNYSDSTPDVTFTYDDSTIAYSKGKLAKIVTGDTANPVSVTKYTAFDRVGRIKSSQQTTSGQTYTFPDYSYNLSGALISQTYHSGRIVKYDYDSDGDLLRVTGQKNANMGAKLYASAFTYNPVGAIESMRLGNGRWESNQFNARGQITQLGLGTNSTDTSLLKLELSYGTAQLNNGSLREQKISYTGLSQPMIQTYGYDDLNRLRTVTETYNGGAAQSFQQTFTLDRYGNRTGLNAVINGVPQAQNKVTNPQIDAAKNRFIEDQDGDFLKDYEYDPAGNLIRDAEGKLFAYDAENRQKSFGTNGSNSNGGSYVYDGLGKRVKKTVGQIETIFVYDAFGKLVAEYENTAPPQNGTQYLTTDHLGSPRVVTNNTGEVVSRHDYMAYGEEIFAGTANRTTTDKYPQLNTVPQYLDNVRQQFTGYERDTESGLDYAQARYYNSKHGRFTSVDPLTASATIRNPQTFNRYSYVLNSPYKFTDPLGLLSMYTTGACGNDCSKSDGKTEKTEEELEEEWRWKTFYGAVYGGEIIDFESSFTTQQESPATFEPIDPPNKLTFWYEWKSRRSKDGLVAPILPPNNRTYLDDESLNDLNEIYAEAYKIYYSIEVLEGLKGKVGGEVTELAVTVSGKIAFSGDKEKPVSGDASVSAASKVTYVSINQLKMNLYTALASDTNSERIKTIAGRNFYNRETGQMQKIGTVDATEFVKISRVAAQKQAKQVAVKFLKSIP